MDHPNRDRIREAYRAFGEGDMETLVSMWTPDVVWHQPGSHRLSGDHEGPEKVLAFFGGLMEATGGTFRVELHSALADDVQGFSLHKATAQRDGTDYEQWSVLTYRIVDGRIAEIWTFPYDATVEEALFG